MDVIVDCHGRVHKGMAKQLVKLLEQQQPLFIQGVLLDALSTFCQFH
jgi:galactonate dehydratase